MNRKKWSNEEKITIALEMIRGEDSVAAICARHGISATQAYRWQEQFLAGGEPRCRINDGGPWLTDSELLFEKQTIIPELQLLLANIPR